MILVRLAAALVRLWTRAYTCGMDPDARERRRAEIESDLFEETTAARGSVRLAASLLFRMMAGAHHDVLWRAESRAPTRRPLRLRMMVASAALAIAAAVWTILAAAPAPPPDPPDAPRFRSRLELRPMPRPPPPPPPPCPPESGGTSARPCTKWP